MTRQYPISGIAAVLAAAALIGCGSPAVPQGNYGTIVGIVKSTSGQPVAGAIVTADSVLTATTGSDGRYTIQTVPVDSANTSTTVTCEANGYASPPAVTVTISAGKQAEADFTLAPQ
jgi:hypothetical protein